MTGVASHRGHPTRGNIPRLNPQPTAVEQMCHTCRPGRNPGAHLESTSHRCHPILVAFALELTKETFDLPLGYFQDEDSHGQILALAFR